MNATIQSHVANRIQDTYHRSSHVTLVLCLVAMTVMGTSAALIGKSLFDLAATREAATHALAVSSALKDLNSQMLDAETGERGFLLSGRPIYLQPYYEALTQMEK